MDLSIYQAQALQCEHLEEVTALWRLAMSEALGIAPVHSFAAQAYFLEHVLAAQFRVLVVVRIRDSKPVAFLACSPLQINQLYVSPSAQGQGIGGYLVEAAKQQSAGALTLRTFEVNKRAQTFYQNHGFIFYPGNANNEEGLPDLEGRWQSEG